MNCVKCPIVEECETGKETLLAEHTSLDFIPIKMSAYNIEDCPLLKLIREIKT